MSTEIEMTDGTQGIVIAVRVHAGARRTEIAGVHDHALKVTVTQAPEKGKANKAVLDLLCRSLGLRKSQVELVSGATSGKKKFAITGVSREALKEKINSALG